MSEQYDPKDLSNGHYPHLRKVAIDDPEWLDINRWLTAKGAPPYTRLYVAKGLTWGNESGILPTEMHWKTDTDTPLKLDAALVFNFPHVALVELKRVFGFGDPNVLEMYPGVRKPAASIDQNPIGEPWPDRPGEYRPSAYDQANPLPYGTVWTDGRGSFVREKRGWAFISYPAWRKVL